MRIVLALLLLCAVATADQITVIVSREDVVETTMDDAGAVTTNAVCRYVYSVPLAVGQSQNSRTYSGNVSSQLVSNDIAADVPRLLAWTGVSNRIVTVQMPGGAP